MEKKILEKNKQYLKKLYFGQLEYFETWNLSDYQEDDLIAFIEDLEKHQDFEDELKMMRMYLRLAKRQPSHPKPVAPRALGVILFQNKILSFN